MGMARWRESTRKETADSGGAEKGRWSRSLSRSCGCLGVTGGLGVSERGRPEHPLVAGARLKWASDLHSPTLGMMENADALIFRFQEVFTQRVLVRHHELPGVMS